MKPKKSSIVNVKDAAPEQRLIAAILKQAVMDAVRLQKINVRKWTRNGKQLPYPPELDLQIYFRSTVFQNHLDSLGYDREYFFKQLERKCQV